MFSRSISPLLTPQHLQNSSMPCWSFWSSTIQKLTDTTTQQWHNTHLLSYIPHWCDSKKKEALVSYSQNIHIPEGTSVSSNKFIKKKEVRKFLGFLLLLCLAPQFFCNRSSTIRQMQRKITSIAKLPSTELPNSLLCSQKSLLLLFPKTTFLIFFFRTPFVSSRSILSKLPCLLLYAPKPPFHNCSTDPDHNIRAAIQPPFNSSHPVNLPAKTPHTNQAVLPMQM